MESSANWMLVMMEDNTPELRRQPLLPLPSPLFQPRPALVLAHALVPTREPVSN